MKEIVGTVQHTRSYLQIQYVENNETLTLELPKDKLLGLETGDKVKIKIEVIKEK